MQNCLEEANFAALVKKFPGVPVEGNNRAETSPFHLFHAANSVCSQKARATLFFHEMPFVSHTVNIFAGESYAPEYVRARILGCAAAGMSLSTFHSGSTSAQKTGCDACVVPTLVDETDRGVVVDSVRICLAMDESRPIGSPSLVPAELREAILAELELVDGLPNYPLLGAAIAKKNNYTGEGNPFAASKVERCDLLISQHAGDAALVNAYDAKRQKELSADKSLFSDAALEVSRQKMATALLELESRLGRVKGAFLFGDQPTLADLYWAVELVRSDDLSMDYLWADGRLLRVADYYGQLCMLPAVRAAILDWPAARLDFKH